MWPIKLFVFMIVLYYGTCSGPNVMMMVHPQVHFCQADFFALVIPTNKTQTTIGSHYKIDVFKIYKSTKGADRFLYKGIYVRLADTSCGYNLLLNEPYVIGGRIKGMKAYISFEDYAKLYEQVSTYQEEAFENYFYGGCECGVRYCKNQNACNAYATKFQCAADVTKKPNCYTNVGICAPNEKGVCKWVEDEVFLKCMGSQRKK